MSRTPLSHRLLRLAAAWGPLCLLAAVALALSVAATRRVLWYDELFSYYIARLPHPRAVLAALMSGADNGPPLDYLARHASMKLLGDGSWAFRLPSILAGVGGLACLGALAARSLSRAATATVLALPLGTLAMHYATEGRAYGALFACAALSLLAWQRASSSPRPGGWLVVLAVSLAAAPLSHYYGVFNYLPIVVAEATRAARRRAVSRPMLACLAVSLLPLLLVPPFARHALEMKQHFWAHQVGLGSLLQAYRQLLGICSLVGPLLCALALAGWLTRGRAGRASAPAVAEAPASARADADPALALGAAVGPGAVAGMGAAAGLGAAAVTLALLPVCIWIAAALYTNAATARYAIAAVAGFAWIAGEAVGALERLGRAGRRAAWIVPVMVLALGLSNLREEVAASGDAPIPAEVTQLVARSARPIAVDSPLLFLQLFHSLPAEARDRLVYLVDREASLRHLGFDNDDIALPNLGHVAPVRTEAYAAFCAREQQFEVLAQRNRYWLLAQLAADGARVVPVARYDRIEVVRVSLR